MSKDLFKKGAAELKKAWAAGYKAKDELAAGGQSFMPDDGKYIVALTDATLGESQSSGRPQIDWEYTFIEGDYKGKTKHVYDGLDRPEGIPYVMRRIALMGGDVPEELEGLEEVLAKLVKAQPKMRVRVKTKDDFVNIYVMHLVDEDGNIIRGEETKAKAAAVSPESPAQEEAAGGDEGVDIVVGLRVRCYDDNDKEVGVGEVTDTDEAAGEVTVKLDSGKRQIFTADKIAALPKEAAAKPKAGMKARK